MVSVGAKAGELTAGLGCEPLTKVPGAVGLDPAANVVATRGAPLRLPAVPLGETSRLGRAALWFGSALDQPHGATPTEADVAATRAAAANVGERAWASATSIPQRRSGCGGCGQHRSGGKEWKRALPGCVGTGART